MGNLRGEGDAVEYSYRDQRTSGGAMKRFRPGVVPTLVVALLLPLLVSLGFWQLGRGAEKTALLNTYAERRAAEPMSNTELQHTQEPAQPFQDQTTGLWLLVNRGWLPWPDRRTPPQFTTPSQVLSLDAWVYVPPGETFQLQADPNATTWPELVTVVDPAKLWTTLDREGFAYELREESGPASYRADWPVVALGPEKHIAYAVQWFAMAIALLGLFIYLGWHNAKEKHHGSGHESTQHV